MNIKIIVVSHKKAKMPGGSVYVPMHVGLSPVPEGYISDNTGDNISSKNPCFCELTGLYWAWKNMKADYIGLVHYRRYFAKKFYLSRSFFDIATEKEFEKRLKKYPLILPKKRRYWIETVYSHYAHTHHERDLQTTFEVIKDIYPDYVETYQSVLRKRFAHMFNMMVAKKEILDAYCSWLFPILFEVERRLDTSGYNAYERRAIGRISEILLNVWVEKNAVPYCEMPTVILGKVDWKRKIISFLKAKFLKQKYKSSF